MDWALSRAAVSPPTTPVHAGTFGAGGGLSSGVGSRDVGIVQLEVRDQGKTFCGGAIGVKGRKMCVGVACRIEGHKMKKVDLSAMVGWCLFIVTTASPDLQKIAVHVEPSIPSRSLGTNLTRYLAERRALEGWDILFRGLQAAEEDEGVTDDTVYNITKRVDGRGIQEKYGVTPHKKRTKLEVTSPALEANFELTMPEVEENLLGDTTEEILQSLRVEWKVMATNINTLKEMVNGCRSIAREVSEATMGEFGEVDFELGRLANLVGSRSGNMDPLPIFRLLGDLSEEVTELHLKSESASGGGLPAGMDRAELAQAGKLATELARGGVTGKDLLQTIAFVKSFHDPAGSGPALKLAMGKEVLASFAPLVAFFSKWSTGKSTPGDVLDQELAGIRGIITALRAGQASGKVAASATPAASTPAAASGVAWGIGAMGLGAAGQGPIPSAGTTPGATAAALKDLEDRVKSIEDQLQAKTVSMGGIIFKSQTLTSAWLGANAPASGAFIFFLDAHAMLSLAADEAGSARSVIHFQHSAAKGGYGSTEEALVAASFKIELPAIFGADSMSMQITADTRALPGMKTPEAWDPENGYTGGRLRFEALIKEAKETMLGSVGDHLVGMGKIVAIECIMNSFNFLMKLSEWMTKQQRNLVGRGGEPEACWKLVSHCVRAIFRDLHSARMAGRGPFLGTNRSAGIVWGCLQAHRVMAEYLAEDFAAHPKCSHILNIHLQDNAMMKTQHDAMHTKTQLLISGLQTKYADLKKAHDTLSTKVGALKK
jgi:hypothetical protein